MELIDTFDLNSVVEALTAVTDAVALSSVDRQKLVVLVQSRQSSDDDDSELRGQVNLEWNTDLVETLKLENRISQTEHCLYSGNECHESRRAHELPGARRRAVDEAHTLTIGCQARGERKSCV